jgi:two-component system LytT family sensor kinase
MSVRNLPIPYKYTILIGFGVGALFGLKTFLMFLYWREMEYFAFERHVLIPIVNYATWGVLMPLAYFFFTRFKLGKENSVWGNTLAIAASLLMSFIHEIFSNVVYYLPMHLLGYQPFSREILHHIVSSLPSAVITRLIEYWILYAVVTGLEFQRKFQKKQIELAQMESQLSNAQLSALRLQLQPHFLFNTLNTISSLMELNVKDAQKIVSKLGNLLRSVLDKEKKDIVPLQEELYFVKNYLDIEQVRFQDRLKIRYDTSEDALKCHVPSFILQPLVENAVKHGFAHQIGAGQIKVGARTEAGRLLLSVKDDGRGSSKTPAQLFNKGRGLQNVKKRLDLLYKTDYLVDIKTAPGKGFAITVEIPCVEEPSRIE